MFKPPHDSVCREAVLSDRIRHRRTNSKKARNYWNPLFAVNCIDRELRLGPSVTRFGSL